MSSKSGIKKNQEAHKPPAHLDQQNLVLLLWYTVSVLNLTQDWQV